MEFYDCDLESFPVRAGAVGDNFIARQYFGAASVVSNSALGAG